MRHVRPTLAVALLLGLAGAPTALAQGLPSDVEQKLGIRPNSKPDYERSRRALPSDVEQRLGVRPNSLNDGRDGRGPRSTGWQDFGVGAQRYPDGPRRYGYDRYDPQEACERQAYRQGLYGSELRRYMRWCLSRG